MWINLESIAVTNKNRHENLLIKKKVMHRKLLKKSYPNAIHRHSQLIQKVIHKHKK